MKPSIKVQITNDIRIKLIVCFRNQIHHMAQGQIWGGTATKIGTGATNQVINQVWGQVERQVRDRAEREP